MQYKFGQFDVPLNEEFEASQALYAPGLATIIDSPTRPGKKACRITLQPIKSFMDDNHRAHLLQKGTLFGFNPGTTFWWAISITLAADHRAATGWECSSEIHSGWHGPAQSYGGSAPFNHDHMGNEWHLIVRGGTVKTEAVDPSSPIPSQAIWGGTKIGTYGHRGGFANNFPAAVQLGKRYDWLWGWRLAGDNTGWFEAWCNNIPVVPRVNLPTCYLVQGGISDNFIMTGGYRQGQGGANAFNASFVLEGGQIFDNFNEAMAYHSAMVTGGGVVIPPTTPQPTRLTSSITEGASLPASKTTWTVSVANTDTVEFWANNVKIATKPVAQEKATADIDLSAAPFKVGANMIGNALIKGTAKTLPANINLTVTAPTTPTGPDLPAIAAQLNKIAGDLQNIAGQLV